MTRPSTTGWTMRVPVRPMKGRWPALLERRFGRFFWDDPAVLLEADPAAAAFSRAMAGLHVGSTIKITGSDRHATCDDLLLEHLDLADATIVDLGASDGTTSAELIRRLPAFRSYIIADLFLHLTAVQALGFLMFHDPTGQCVLISGHGIIAWPRSSAGVRTAAAPLRAAARRRPRPAQDVLLLGPDARSLIATDPRISAAVHDVFLPWPGPVPDVIKVANVLRRLYFDDSAIVRALHALAASLPADGHLLIVDNVRQKGVAARGGLYRRTDDHFHHVAGAEGTPEIEDLILQLHLEPPVVTRPGRGG